MDYKQAIFEFAKQFPKLKVLRCIDYSNDHYIMEAVEATDVTDYNSPFYAVNKNSGEVTTFIPTLDLDAFFDAVENRTVYSTY